MRVLVLLILVLGLYSFNAEAQLRVENPIDFITSIEFQDNSQFFYPGELPIPLGDIDLDGKIEYANYVRFSSDKRTEELGDYTDKTQVCEMDENYQPVNCAYFNGGLIHPVGDMTNDGTPDIAIVDSESKEIKVYDLDDDFYYMYDNDEEDDAFVDVVSDLEDANSDELQVFVGTLDQLPVIKDFNRDGFDDFLYQAREEDTGFIYLIVAYGAPNPNDINFKSYDIDRVPALEEFFANKAMTVNAGDVTGDEKPEIVALSRSFSECNLRAEVFEVDDQDELNHLQTVDLGGCSNNISGSDYRLQIYNVDGEQKDDLVYSQNYHNEPGASFVQFTTNQPRTFAARSTGDEQIFEQQQTLYANHYLDRIYGDAEGNSVIVGGAPSSTIGCRSSQILGISEGTSTPLCQSSVFDETDFPNADGIYASRFYPNTYQGYYQRLDDIIENEVVVNIPVLDELRYAVQNFNFAIGPVADIDPQAAEAFLVSFFQILLNTNQAFTLPEDVIYEFKEQFLGLLYSSSRYDGKIVLTPANISNPNFNIPFTSPLLEQLPEKITKANGADLFVVDDQITGLRPQGQNKIISSTIDTLDQIIEVDVSQFQDFGTFINLNLENIGDINNDGADDILLAPTFTSEGFNPILKAWIWYGSNPQLTLSATPDVTIDFSSDTTITENSFPDIGTAIEPLGDVNGDTIDDFALGVTGHENRGSVYVFFGSDDAEKFNISASNGVSDLILRPEVKEGETISQFGAGIAGGDFDGDGFNDIAVISRSGFGSDSIPTIQVYSGGPEMDGEPDYLLNLRREQVGGEGSAIIAATFSSTIQFLPFEQGVTHQDLLYQTGGFSGFPDAAIFHGGNNLDSDPDVILRNPNREFSFGYLNKTKAATGDFNQDGFYDIWLTNQFSNEEALSSSRTYIFSPNSDLTVDLEDEIDLAVSFELKQNFPNPFNPSTNIQFELPVSSNVTLKIFNILGQEVATLINNERLTAGTQVVPYNASNLASGVYLYRIEAGNFVKTRKMTLIK